jgi:hypothetical protein
MTNVSASVAFQGQNWVITPAALAATEAKPTIANQKWILVLTGDAIINFGALSSGPAIYQTVTISPDWSSPLQWAIFQWGIPVPANPSGPPPQPVLSLVEWAPHAATASTLSRDADGSRADFTVDVWRPTPFPKSQPAFPSGTVANMFSGMDVDLSVFTNQATAARISYHITLIGTIAFIPPIM